MENTKKTLLLVEDEAIIGLNEKIDLENIINDEKSDRNNNTIGKQLGNGINIEEQNKNKIAKVKAAPMAIGLPIAKIIKIKNLFLEKERSSYWAQFRAGLLSATAVAQLDNNLSEFLDFQGKVPMNDRGYLDRVCGVSKMTEAIREVPLLKKYFTDKITVSTPQSHTFSMRYCTS